MSPWVLSSRAFGGVLLGRRGQPLPTLGLTRGSWQNVAGPKRPPDRGPSRKANDFYTRPRGRNRPGGILRTTTRGLPDAPRNPAVPGMAGQGRRLAARRSEMKTSSAACPDSARSSSPGPAKGRHGVGADQSAAAIECHRRFSAWVATQLPTSNGGTPFTVTGAVIARLEGVGRATGPRAGFT